MMEDADDPRTSAVVADLVGGLDSHIRALCRNLASLVLPDRWLTREPTSQRPPTPAPGPKSPSDVKVLDLVSASDDDRHVARLVRSCNAGINPAYVRGQSVSQSSTI